MARVIKCRQCKQHLGEVRQAPNPNYNLGCGQDRYVEVAYWDESTQILGDSTGVKRVICSKCETEHVVYSRSGTSCVLRRKRKIF